MIINNILLWLLASFPHIVICEQIIIFYLSNNKNRHIVVDFPISEKYMLTYYTWDCDAIKTSTSYCLERNSLCWIKSNISDLILCLRKARINEIISLHHNNCYAQFVNITSIDLQKWHCINVRCIRLKVCYAWNISRQLIK